MTAIPTFVNPKAGSAERVLAALRDDSRCRVVEIEPSKLADAIRAEIAGGATRVIVSGGDGTLHTAASVLAGTAVELGIIPGGTLNHFAKFIGLPEDPVEAAQIAVGDSVRTVDVARVNGELMLNTSSVGAYVVFVHARERLERRFGYAVASVLALIRVATDLRRYRVVVEVGDKTRVYNTPLLFIGVGERELKIPLLGDRVPNGERGLHMIIARGNARSKLLLTTVAAALRGLRAVEPESTTIDSFIVDRVRIHLRRRRGNVALDGELVPLSAPYEFVVERDTLRVAAADATGDIT
ncbi:MAG: diacylglycerol kinase family protein [Gemmatimonadaceae bacterium]